MTASGDGQTAGARIVGRARQAARRDVRLIDGMRAGVVLIRGPHKMKERLR